MTGENSGVRKSLLRLFRRALGVDNLASDMSQRLSIDLRTGLENIRIALEASADTRASQQENHLVSALNLEARRGAAFLENAITGQSQFQVDQLIAALNKAAHHNAAYLEEAFARQVHLRIEELGVTLNEEAHRNAVYLEGAFARQIHLRVEELAVTLNEEAHRNAAYLEEAFARQVHLRIEELAVTLNEEAHRNTAYLEEAFARQIHLRVEELAVTLNEEAHRNAAHLEEAFARQLHLRATQIKQEIVAELLEVLSDELQRNIAYIDGRLTEHFAKQHETHSAFEANRLLPNNSEIINALKDSQAFVLQELHHQMSHVDTHLSAHLTKELSLHLGSQNGNGIIRSSSALAQQRLLTLGKLLEPQAAIGKTKRRIGHESDGGYVMLDDFNATRFALSLGVGAEMTWDVAMADLGVDVHQFDYTIEAPPLRHDRIYFHQSRIAAVAEGTDHSLSSAQALGGRQICIIKMDIEGDEWSVLDAAVEGDFDNVTQLICEFHDFDKVDDERWFNCAERVLKSLSEIFCVVHVHANNNGALNVRGNIAFPDILEISFANKRFHEFEATREVFPTPLDAPNRQDLPDIVLGAFRF